MSDLEATKSACKAAGHIIDSALERITGRRWDGDTPIERLENALCDVHSSVSCGVCGHGVRLRHAIGPRHLCSTCAAKVIDAADMLEKCLNDILEYLQGHPGRDWTMPVVRKHLANYRAVKGETR
jgi:hypothetical protein